MSYSRGWLTRWIAVWKWNWWTWCAIMVLMPVVYLLTVSPAAYGFCRCCGIKNHFTANALHVATWPAAKLAIKVPAYRKLIEFEWDLMTALFGDVPGISGL